MRYVIGDVHGEAKALEGLVSEIRKRDSDAEFYFVGDFVDRGPDSKRVVEMVIDLGGRACRGNHDDVMDMILSGRSASTTAGGANEAAEQTIWFLQYGMAGTLKSYGIQGETLYRLTDAVEQTVNPVAVSRDNMFEDDSDEREAEGVARCQAILEEIRSFVPVEHKKFFRELPVMYDAGDFFMIHAFLPSEANGDLVGLLEARNDVRQNAIWGRFGWTDIREPKKWGKQGFFGHTPTKHYGMAGRAVVGESMALIDTGATFGDGLTAFCVETVECIRVNKSGEIWPYN